MYPHYKVYPVFLYNTQLSHWPCKSCNVAEAAQLQGIGWPVQCLRFIDALPRKLGDIATIVVTGDTLRTN